MKYVCLCIVLILLFLYQRNKYILEGFTTPTRYIDRDLQDYLNIGNMNTLNLSKDEKNIQDSNINPILARQNSMSRIEGTFARMNTKECKDSGNYSGCILPSPSPRQMFIDNIDMRYISLPSTQLDPSSDYNFLSTCPQAYQKNMDILRSKTSIGQYSGYTPNEYIDKTRYIDISKSGPLPVNPDFFMKNGGTY